MKKFLLGVVGIAIMLMVAYTPQTLKAQVNGEFKSITLVENTPYVELTDGTVIPNTAFGLPPTYSPENSDDGYYRVNLGFDFEFNGEIFSQAWICVNGYITLTPPPFLPVKDVNALFLQANNFPTNTIAPYWGDHYYRDLEDFYTNGFVPSEISYKTELINGAHVFTVQWKNMNINYKDGNTELKASVANFQLRLYESKDAYTKQGNIEFAYGVIGQNPGVPDTKVVTRGAVIGVKGEGKIIGEGADYLNGLMFNQDIDLASTSQAKTVGWQPSGGTDKRILFTSFARTNVAEWWGDGDVDFSKGFGKKHYGMAQNRFVTVNDARLIMRSVAFEEPLDPVRRRAAYHADVNHNGRYYYNNANTRVNVPHRSYVFTDDLPAEVSSVKQILFEANEVDAAVILKYMSGRCGQLPYLLDTFPNYGKVYNEIATNFNVLSVTKLNTGDYQVALGLNADLSGILGAKFEVNGQITDLVKNSAYDNMLMTYNNNRVVIAGDANFNANTPLFVLTVKLNDNSLNINKIRFNDAQVSDISYAVSSVEDNNSNTTLAAYPNPFVTSTVFTVNVTNDDVYELSIYDLLGNKVSTLANTNLKSGSYTYFWNGTDFAGTTLPYGVYVYRLSNGTNTVSNKIVFGN